MTNNFSPKKLLSLFLFLIFSFISLCQESNSQNSSLKGLNGMIEFGYYSWEIKEFFDESEGSYMIDLGVSFGITEWVSPYLSFTFVPSIKAIDPNDMLGTYSLGQLNLGLMFYTWQKASKFRPFAGVAYSLNRSKQSFYATDMNGSTFIAEDLKISASGISLEGGLLYFLKPNLALKASIQFGVLLTDKFESVEADINSDMENRVNGMRIGIGVLYNSEL